VRQPDEIDNAGRRLLSITLGTRALGRENTPGTAALCRRDHRHAHGPRLRFRPRASEQPNANQSRAAPALPRG
jgi:hypothetical protein